METKLSVNQYKLFVIIIKFIPIIWSAMIFVNTILRLFGIELYIFTVIGGVSFTSLLAYYVASYLLHFCDYHRMFLHYITAVTIINTIDLYFTIGFIANNLLILVMIITFIFLIITLYKYLKSKRHVDKNI